MLSQESSFTLPVSPLAGLCDAVCGFQNRLTNLTAKAIITQKENNTWQER